MRPPRPPLFRRRWAALLALAGGLLGVLAFPRYGIWPMAFVSVAALSVAVDGRRSRTAAWLGYLYGAAFLVPLVSWTGIYVGPVPWLILALAFAAFFALLGAIIPALARLPGGAGLGRRRVGARRRRCGPRCPFGGFPWGRLAFSQATSPLRWFAPLGGAPLVTFAVGAGGAALAAGALACCRPGTARRERVRSAAVGVVAVVVVTLLGACWRGRSGPGSARSHRTHRGDPGRLARSRAGVREPRRTGPRQPRHSRR